LLLEVLILQLVARRREQLRLARSHRSVLLQRERKVVQPNGQGNALNESSSARRSGRANARDPARRFGHQNDLSKGHGGTFVPLSQTCGRLSVVSAGRNVDCVWRWRLLR
jgi:hypothetical protein